jgi:hypothetical protein
MKSPFHLACSGIGALTRDADPTGPIVKKKGPWIFPRPFSFKNPKTKRTVGIGSAHGPGFFFMRYYSFKNRESRRQPENVAPPPKLRFGFPK